MVLKRILKDEAIHKAFRLAHTLHPDRIVAWCVTRDGLDRASLLKSLQEKRPGARTPFKMKTPEEALPQVGIYYASDSWERDQEGAGKQKEPLYEPGPDDLVVRYIKLLVCETMHRDTGNVAVGIGTLLYTYLTSQVSSLAPDIFDDGNIRRDKSRLVAKIKDRFPDSTIATNKRSPDGQEKALVRTSLSLFAPWISPHGLSARYNKNLLDKWFCDGLPKLSWERNHVLIDPECGGFHRLVDEYNDYFPKGSAMRLEDPDNKLAIPIFTGSNHDNNNRFDPPPLTPTEIHSIKDVLNTNRLRRKAFSSGRIRVSVDGTERTRFCAEGSGRQPFSIPLTASYIEVFGQDDDGELLLGIFPLWDLEAMSDGQQRELSITAEGGQKIHCVISPQTDSKGELIAGEARVDVTPAHSKTPKLLSRWAKISRDCESGQPRRSKATSVFYPSKLIPDCLRLRREEGGRTKQTTDLSPLVAGMVSNDPSTLAARMVSEVVAGVITGVTSGRRFYYRNLILIAIIVAGFTLAIVFWDRLSVSVRPAQGNISTPTPERDQRPEPTPRAPDDGEELRRLRRPNPM